MMKILRINLFVFLLLALSFRVTAQEFLPTLSDNYMGINQVILQPASIYDSRFKVDANLFGFNTDVYNNAVRLKTGWMFNLGSMENNEFWWDEYGRLADKNGKDKSLFNMQSVLGPSFLVSIGKKHAIGFSSRIRNMTNIDDVSEPLFLTLYDNFGEEEYWNKWLYDENIRFMQHAFADYGLSYATLALNTGKHFLKAGGTVKLVQGISAIYLQTNDLYFYFDGTNQEAAYPMSWNSPSVDFGLSGNWASLDEQGKPESFKMNYQFTAKPTVGLDLGVVYEFRPDHESYFYDMDGRTGIERRDQNKYKVKVGLSVLDIGRLKYEKKYNTYDFRINLTPDYLERYQNNDNSVPDLTYWLDLVNSTNSYSEIMGLIDTIFQRDVSGQGTSKQEDEDNMFTVKLPTAISLQADVNVIEGLYVNLTTFTGLCQGYKKPSNSHYVSTYSITPRYEHKWFSVSLPMIINQYAKFNVGLGIRAAFLYMGVNNLISGVFSDPHSINAYIGVKVPIYYPRPPRDTDEDKVSDKRDLCVAVPGIWEFYGCPDRDGDSIPDKDDACPDIPGLKEFGGCPDRDGDGIPDKDDLCPDEPGPKITNGCPDRDADGIIDSRDECPDNPGLEQFNGCPDRDGDGIPDHKDQCPDEPGPADQGGCPFKDTDQDGIKDTEDRCPTQPGPPENFGCPYTDTDGDGVIDKDDRCPLTPGDPANFGCPVIKREEETILKTAFENLEFESGKNVIKSSSFTSLNELVILLISKPSWKLRISGHTDNVGSDATNLALSKNRAQATAAYLQGKGVAASRLIIEWFGETMPVADNDTPEGRQKNRRVEMQVVFE